MPRFQGVIALKKFFARGFDAALAGHQHLQMRGEEEQAADPAQFFRNDRAGVLDNSGVSRPALPPQIDKYRLKLETSVRLEGP